MSRRPDVPSSMPDARVNLTDQWPYQLAELASSALAATIELMPKPGLVNWSASLTPAAMSVLKDGFLAVAAACTSVERPSERMREELGRIGREMEKRILTPADATGGHRGAIWALGLLVASAARRRHDRGPTGIVAGAAAIALMPDRFAPDLITAGDRARLRFGAAGARGEAQRAFPHVTGIGLPMLLDGRARLLTQDEARLDTLLAIMSSLEDTALLHQGGRGALDAARSGARAVLDAGGTATDAGRRRLARLDSRLRALHACPRGSANLLSATLFLDRLGAQDRSLGCLGAKSAHAERSLSL